MYKSLLSDLQKGPNDRQIQIPLHSATSPTQDPDNLVNSEEDFLSSRTLFGNPEYL